VYTNSQILFLTHKLLRHCPSGTNQYTFQFLTQVSSINCTSSYIRWFGFHRNTNQHHLAAKMSTSKVYPLSLGWCRAHECTHFTNGNNSNCVGKQPSKLCVNFICITQLFLCVKFDVRWQWRHSLFHKYRPSLHWNVTGNWIKM
jgi:hypothetical protein